MAEEEALGLRERKKLDTRRALSDAALTLAFESGLENVTRDGIAARAGVSVRTFNNYFTGKYDAIAYRQLERFRLGLAVLRERPADEPLWDSIAAALVRPLEIENRATTAPEPAHLIEVRKLFASPEIRAIIARNNIADWATAIAERTGIDPLRDPYPHLVAGVINAVVESSSLAYAHADPPEPVAALLHRTLAQVTAGLPPPPRSN
ncbi:TetR/AcrR family transcriptional regulator [Nocardia callitridis]|uniref:TetR family transcriptional regulator n=1 Tax=Nocardia callitridis TaxID=648753 RepID=A0ABP9KMB0_9NOCA